ncbi:MAG: hypothetical protein OET90_08720, partial [Desulfuromonadales bacterium]|nr:hypothetical protein [Desulfuromonadales bacterium]
MSEQVKTYQIGEQIYEQRPLVLAQWRQLQQLLDGLEIAAAEDTMKGLISALDQEGRLEQAIAILLSPQGVSPRDKDCDLLAKELPYLLQPEHIAQVFIDFFDYNPANSVLSAMAGVMMALTRCMARYNQELAQQETEPQSEATGSSKPASSSQQETGASATPSSG